MRKGTYFLINAPQLDINHNHTPYFRNRDTQLTWFMNKTSYKINDVQFHRKDSSISVPYFIDDLNYINYVATYNESEGKYYYYHVYDKTYLNDNNTYLTLKLDVIQTYLFEMDYSYHESLIDRSHVYRFNSSGLPILENIIVPEDLEVGEYVEYTRYPIYDYENNGAYIVTSTDKLTSNNGGGSGGGSGGGVSQKKVSADLFVFLKGYEAFSPTPYDDGLGYMTIGYGVTQKYQPDYYNQLAPNCTEEEASEVMNTMMYNNFSSAVYDNISSRGVDMSTVKQNEFDAFVSFAYNSGIGGLTSSGIFIDYCNGGDKNAIAEKWKTTNIMEGSPVESGLRARRLAESNIFLNGVYEFRPIGIVGGGTVTTNGGKGHIPNDLLVPDTSDLNNQLVASARKLIGNPYVWGGNYPPLGGDNGTDCSGLMQWAYNDNGLKISRTTYTQINEGIEIHRDDVQKGDLVFSNFSSPNVPEHVFMYSGISNGNHMCVEAQQTGTDIMERAFTFNNSMRVRRLI